MMFQISRSWFYIFAFLKKCLEMPGVHLVELPVDYSENDRILNHEIKERSQKI